MFVDYCSSGSAVAWAIKHEGQIRTGHKTVAAKGTVDGELLAIYEGIMSTAGHKLSLTLWSDNREAINAINVVKQNPLQSQGFKWR